MQIFVKTLTTPIRSNEEGIPPGQQVDVEGSLQSPNYTQANSNEEERELENDESNEDFLKNSISLRRNTG
ncbi:uncharacterized protein OCT59_029406 [Rhizophagus irregularis]|uniref:Uncharacterized protein n=1 Tax=Rhizophagus irregularis (strain DAOM 181602 / DAOM 197198 / MUCL 43194) TaxID=747089 RepID=U9SNI9_RHIID|nr:hypothetical protein OCT59_029406 [Rhizophagus irregularis]